MLTPEEALEFTGHAVGGVCPFALKTDVKVYLDESMKRFETVFPAAGSSNSSIELTCDELNRYSNCEKWLDVCKTYPDIDNLILLRDIFNTTIDDLVLREDKVDDNKIEVNYSNTDEINYCKENNTKKDDLSVDLMIDCTIIGMILGTITGNYMWSMAGFIGLGLGFIIEPIGKYLKSSVKK